MSDRTPSVASVNPTPVTPEQAQQYAASLAAVPLYANATPQVQALLCQDMAGACEQGLSPAEYLDGVTTWPGTAEELLAESGLWPVQEQATNPEQATPADAVVQGTADAAAEAEQQERQQREAAESVRQQAVKAYRKGEKAYRVGLLESGRLCGEYLSRRLALGDARKAAVQALEGALAPWSSSAVDVSRLVRTYHAFRLLAVEQGLVGEDKKAGPADSVPYGVYRDHWVRLVERSTDAVGEVYTLLPGLEQQCLAAFKDAVANGLSADAVRARCGALVVEYSQQQSERERLASFAAQNNAQARQQQALDAAKSLAAAEKERQYAEQAAKAEQDAVRGEQLRASLAEQEAAVEQRRRDMVAAQQVADDARKAADKAAKDAEAAAVRMAAAADKAARKAEQQAAKPAPAPVAKPADKAPATDADSGPGPITGNLLRIGKAGTAKDVAGMVCELLSGCDDAAAVLECVGRQLDWKPAYATALVRGMIAGGAVRSVQALYLAARTADGKEQADALKAKRGGLETANGQLAVA